MKRKIALLVLAATALVAARCDTADEVTILHTNDIHNHLRPTRADPFNLGGIARLSTLIERQRSAATRSLLLDAGDYSEGSWAFNLGAGSEMLRLMNLMGYDAVALGNHDFLNGPGRVIEVRERANATFPVLAENLDLAAYDRADEFRAAIPGTWVKDLNGVRVGVIGLTTFEIVYDYYLAPIKILDPVERARRIAAELRPQVDVLIVLSHNVFETNLQIARSVSGIDAVVSGHSHRKLAEPVFVENAGRRVPIVEASEWGKFLGELTLAVDRRTGKVEFRAWKLHDVGPEVDERPEIAREVRAMIERIGREFGGGDIDRPATRAAFALESVGSRETPLGNLATAAYREATGADLALETANFLGATIAPGVITVEELHDAMPHIYDPGTGKEWTLKLWNARGRDLQLVMTVFYTISRYSPFSSPLGWLLVDNARVTWDPKGSSDLPAALAARVANPIPIRSIQIGGRALDPQARYRAAVTEGLLFAIRQANELLKLGIDLSQLTDTGIEASAAIIRYGMRRPELSLAELDVGQRMISQTPDLGLMSYNLAWDRRTLSVEVRNLGLAPTSAGTLTCFTGLVDDRIRFESDRQVWTELGSAQIPPLLPNGTSGNRVTLSLPWDGGRYAEGVWPVRCRAQVKGDGYEANDSVDTTFRNGREADPG